MTTAIGVGYVEMRIAKVVGLATGEDQPFTTSCWTRWQATGSSASRSVTRRRSAWRLAWVGSPGVGR